MQRKLEKIIGYDARFTYSYTLLYNDYSKNILHILHWSRTSPYLITHISIYYSKL